jgi:hypothetical protein
VPDAPEGLPGELRSGGPADRGVIDMVKEDRLASALYAMHLVLVELRAMAFAGEDPKCIGEILDWVEAMPFLVANPDEDRTAAFRSHLAGIVEQCGRFRRALVAFDAGRDFHG